jgi:hypothetical protein
MKIEFDIPEELFQSLVKESVVKAFSQLVERHAAQAVAQVSSRVDEAIEVALAKRVTDLELKSMIDKSLVERIKNLEF